VLNGSLFTHDFLIEGIRDAAAWTALDGRTVAALHARLTALFTTFGKLKNPAEAETEKELIWPLLEAVGWADMSVQQNLSARARDDVPDALLFADAAAKAEAAPLDPWQRFQHGVCGTSDQFIRSIYGDRYGLHEGPSMVVRNHDLVQLLKGLSCIQSVEARLIDTELPGNLAGAGTRAVARYRGREGSDVSSALRCNKDRMGIGKINVLEKERTGVGQASIRIDLVPMDYLDCDIVVLRGGAVACAEDGRQVAIREHCYLRVILPNLQGRADENFVSDLLP
jgi:hypothetical protein